MDQYWPGRILFALFYSIFSNIEKISQKTVMSTLFYIELIHVML
jgi:hypothetical protein